MLNSSERDFLLGLVEEDNVRVHEEEDDDGWTTYHVEHTDSGPELHIQYTGADGSELDARYILVYQVGVTNEAR